MKMVVLSQEYCKECDEKEEIIEHLAELYLSDKRQGLLRQDMQECLREEIETDI